MLNQKKYSQASQSIFMSSIMGLANVIAFVVAFIGTPMLYGKTIYWIQSYTIRNYGYGWEDLTALVWFVTCALVVFFVSRASISTALVMGGIALATRFV